MRKFIDDFKIKCDSLPDSELHDIYNSIRSVKRLLALIPFGVFLLAFMAFCVCTLIFNVEYVNTFYRFRWCLPCIVFFVIGGVMAISDKNIMRYLNIPIYTLVYIGSAIYADKLGNGNTTAYILLILPFLYLLFTDTMLGIGTAKNNFLKTLPRYPFKETAMDKEFEGMDNQQTLRHMETFCNKGYMLNFDRILDEKVEKPNDVQSAQQVEQSKSTENEEIEQNEQEEEIERILPPDSDWFNNRNDGKND